MGEYVGDIKLGTCEDLYYVRLADVLQMPGAGEYADPRNGFRYRFPFPEEDGTPPGRYDPYDKGLLIFINPTDAPILSASLQSDDFDHGDICHSASYRNAINVNIMFPCVLSPKFPDNLRTSYNGASLAVVLEQQKQVNSEIWVIVSCPYCGAKVRLPKDEAQELAICVSKRENSVSYYAEVAKRIMSGYK